MMSSHGHCIGYEIDVYRKKMKMLQKLDGKDKGSCRYHCIFARQAWNSIAMTALYSKKQLMLLLSTCPAVAEKDTEFSVQNAQYTWVTTRAPIALIAFDLQMHLFYVNSLLHW